MDSFIRVVLRRIGLPLRELNPNSKKCYSGTWFTHRSVITSKISLTGLENILLLPWMKIRKHALTD